MPSSIRKFVLTLLPLVILINMGCAEEDKEIDDSSSVLFTETDIAKTWTASCETGLDPITGATSNILDMTLNADGTYTAAVTWYTGSCSPVNYAVIYRSTGTFVVGGYISGSSSVQSLTFDAASSSIMAFTTTVQTSFNTDCGGTSPYAGGVGAGANGSTRSTYMILCASQLFPNSGNSEIENVASYSSGVLTIGSNYYGVPGVFTSLNATPTTVTIPMN